MQEGWPPDQHKQMRAAERETARLDDGLAILLVAFRFITPMLSMEPNTQRIRSARIRRVKCRLNSNQAANQFSKMGR
jgi:hypothetical protein